MAIEIIAIRLSADGEHHEHVTDHQWRNLETGVVSDSSTATLVEWIGHQDGRAWVGGGTGRVRVHVVSPEAGQPYLRTRANDRWTDNLLSLPRF